MRGNSRRALFVHDARIRIDSWGLLLRTGRRRNCDKPRLRRAQELARMRRSTSAPMTERPRIHGQGRHLGRGQLGPAHWRHGSPILAWLRYAKGDRVRDRSQAAIAPQPFATGEVGALRRALAVGSMAASTRRTCDLALVDALAEGNLLLCRSRWSGQGNRASFFKDVISPLPCSNSATGPLHCGVLIELMSARGQRQV